MTEIAPCNTCGHGYEWHYDGQDYPCHVHGCECAAYERPTKEAA